MYKITTLMFCASLLMAQGSQMTDEALAKQIAHQKKMAEQFLIEKKKYDQIVHQEKMAEQFLIEKKKYDEREAKATMAKMGKKEKAKKQVSKKASVKKKKVSAQKVSTAKPQPAMKKKEQKGHRTGFDHLKSLGL